MSTRFALGQTVATQGALALLTECGQSPTDFLCRHVSGDWGNLDVHDKQANEDAVVQGERLLSSYMTINGQKLWIITEADRSSTTILLPDEY